MKRKPIVAGTFYPGDSIILRNQLERFLSNVSMLPSKKDILGVIAPHAGYVYSGQSAAYAYKALKMKQFNKAVILAPSHRYGNFKFSAGNFESYLTPLGEVKVDTDKIEKLLQYSEFSFHQAAHNAEHSLEVQLPFLQIINEQVEIIPILLGNQSPENSKRLAEILFDEFKDDIINTVFIVSSDLSHYYDHKIAKYMDEKMIDMILKTDVQGLSNALFERKIEACGFGGILSLMHLAKQLAYNETELLNYSHSGMISGDNSQVVGYLSAMIYK
ncbi:MAG: AmmeMemoRadiSam system protein B [Candidatus Cloacimonetes bacterium]|nr:AmmeMemoRadiSam system protein B [Candidatus Cloacimonadota bacterium]MCF7815016.1 AmmeMemoRadiSam system protein B [Candidatus Cloacimonadota bacterium]MCF7859934.1 AmmeMemoRadiSam system protein B [Candidatus Cloacimonadota bacterium]MCF7869263.1 AmmeMemoRadiSam system protein B [Candidatus Cloacimonadota bacterium]